VYDETKKIPGQSPNFTNRNKQNWGKTTKKAECLPQTEISLLRLGVLHGVKKAQGKKKHKFVAVTKEKGKTGGKGAEGRKKRKHYRRATTKQFGINLGGGVEKKL